MRRAALALLALLAPPVEAAIAVADDTGATVRLAAPAQRIVTLAPHATELVFAAGAGDALVAVDEHSDEPPAARALPPPGLLAWLERRGIAVYRSEPRRLADVDRSVAALATLAGRPAPSPPSAASAPPPAPSVTALFLFWDAPPIAAGEDHVLTDLLRSCGATPAIPGLPGKSVVISQESLLAARPDLVLTTDGRVLVPRDGRSAKERLAALPVGEEERLALQAAQRPGPRLHLARAALCARIAGRASGRVPFTQ